MATYFQNRVLKKSPNSVVQWWKLLKWWPIKDIPLACWSSKTFQDKIDSTLDLRPQNLKHDCKWPLKTYLNKQAWTSSAKHEGNEWHKPLHQSYGMPNEMQLIKTDGTPNHEMQKRFDLWRRDNYTDSNRLSSNCISPFFSWCCEIYNWYSFPRDINTWSPFVRCPASCWSFRRGIFFSECGLICIFNGLWSCLIDLQAWISDQWKLLISNELNIYPLARGFFILVFEKDADQQRIFDYDLWFWGNAWLSMQH